MFTKKDIEKYFTAEKKGGLFFLVFGLAGICLALYFFLIHKGQLQAGMAIPLLITGIMEVAVGYAIYTQSDRRRIENVYDYDMNPTQLQDMELARMKKLSRQIVFYRWVEITCLASGIVMVVLFCKRAENSFFLGIGLGLVFLSMIMLTAGFVAERRALQYTKGIKEFLRIK